METLQFRESWSAVFKPGRTVRMHQHEAFHEMIALVSGSLAVRTPNRLLTLEPGDVVHYPSGASHAPSVPGKRSARLLYLTWTGPGVGDVTMAHDRDGRIRHQLEWLQALRWSEDEAGDEQILQSMLIVTLHEWRRLIADTAGLRTRCISWLRDRLDGRVTIDELAAVCELSSSHFARRFRQAYGQTPMAMVQQLRLARARQLIINSGRSIESIARECGFADGAHLAHACLRLHGHGPSHWRN